MRFTARRLTTTQRTRTPRADFNARVRELIDEYFPHVDAKGRVIPWTGGPKPIIGNVSRAARHLGVSQRGLAKVYCGDVTDPGLTMVLALIHGFPNEDPMWIMTGEATVLNREVVAVEVGRMALDFFESMLSTRTERAVPRVVQSQRPTRQPWRVSAGASHANGAAARGD